MQTGLAREIRALPTLSLGTALGLQVLVFEGCRVCCGLWLHRVPSLSWGDVPVVLPLLLLGSGLSSFPLSSFLQGTSMSFRQESDSSCINSQAEINSVSAAVTLPWCLLQRFVFVSRRPSCVPPVQKALVGKFMAQAVNRFILLTFLMLWAPGVGFCSSFSWWEVVGMCLQE